MESEEQKDEAIQPPGTNRMTGKSEGILIAKPMSMEQELEVMATMVRMLEPFEPQARQRVLEFIFDKCGCKPRTTVVRGGLW